MNKSINYEAVYRTAPATPGLLNMLKHTLITWYHIVSHGIKEPSTQNKPENLES